MERSVASDFGGVRRGPGTGDGVNSNGCDIVGPDGTDHPMFGIECKLRTSPHFGDIEQAVTQAEANAKPHQLPIAIVKRKGGPLKDALVAIRYDTFRDWFGTKLAETPNPEGLIPPG